MSKPKKYLIKKGLVFGENGFVVYDMMNVNKPRIDIEKLLNDYLKE